MEPYFSALPKNEDFVVTSCPCFIIDNIWYFKASDFASKFEITLQSFNSLLARKNNDLKETLNHLKSKVVYEYFDKISGKWLTYREYFEKTNRYATNDFRCKLAQRREVAKHSKILGIGGINIIFCKMEFRSLLNRLV